VSMPDYPLGQTMDFKFTTRQFSDGVPTTLAGTPVIQIYEDNSLIQITVGIILTVDFDGVTGLNNLRIAATSGNGFESGKSYAATISTGTVGGVSVVGEIVQQFSIERSPALRPTTAGQTLDVAATGEAGIDLGNTLSNLVAADFGAGSLNGKGDWTVGNVVLTAAGVDAIFDELMAGHVIADSVAVHLKDILADVTGIAGSAMRGTDSALLAANVPTNFADLAITVTTGRVDVNVNNDKSGYILAANGIPIGAIATDAITAAAFATDAINEIRDAIYDGTMTELAADPGASPSLKGAIALLYMAVRNKRDTTATADEIHNNAGTVILTAVVSDDTVVFTKDKYA